MKLSAQVLWEVSSHHNPWLIQIHLALDHASLDPLIFPRKMAHLDVTIVFDTSRVEKLRFSSLLRVPNGYVSKLGDLQICCQLSNEKNLVVYGI